MYDKNAQVEPLPLVPPTVIMGQAGARFIAFFTWVTRSKPMSIGVWWAVSKWASHWGRVLVCMFILLEWNVVAGDAVLHIVDFIDEAA